MIPDLKPNAPQPIRTYKYKRYMRDGSMQEVTAVVRSKRKSKRDRT